MTIMTNYDKYKNLVKEKQMQIALDKDNLCNACTENIEMNLSPGNTCEGRWCDLALEYWLEEEVDV